MVSAIRAAMVRGVAGGGLDANVPAGFYFSEGLSTQETSIQFVAAGTWAASDDGAATGTWKVGGVGADYEIRWTPISGSLSTGTINTWQSLGGTISYGVTQTLVGSNNASGTVEIRLAASPFTVLDSGTITLEATRDS